MRLTREDLRVRHLGPSQECQRTPIPSCRAYRRKARARSTEAARDAARLCNSPASQTIPPGSDLLTSDGNSDMASFFAAALNR